MKGVLYFVSQRFETEKMQQSAIYKHFLATLKRECGEFSKPLSGS
jgi:hypothetical protein